MYKIRNDVSIKNSGISWAIYGYTKSLTNIIMAEGINMGRRSPWSKEYLKTLYNRVDTYCKVATLHAFKSEGQQAANETMAAYNMFKYPVVYVYIH